LIFKELAINRCQGMKTKGPSSTSLLNTTYWMVWSCLFDNKQDLHSSIIDTSNNEYCPILVPWINLLYLGQNRPEKTIMNTMTCPVITQDVEYWLFMFHLSSMSNDKEGANNQEIWVVSTQNNRIWPLGLGLCGSGGSITIRKPAKTHSLLALTMIDPAINTGWFQIVKATNKSATSMHDLFHNTWLARYPRP
jgi:hypothetical protein